MVPLTLVPLDAGFAICRLAADAPTPGWAAVGPFVSITRTTEELSIVCREELVPKAYSASGAGVVSGSRARWTFRWSACWPPCSTRWSRPA